MANNDYDKYIITINGKKREKFIRKGNEQQKNNLLKQYPEAQLSTDEPGKSKSSSIKKSTEQINETGPSQNNPNKNTESNLEVPSSESKSDDKNKTVTVGGRIFKMPTTEDITKQIQINEKNPTSFVFKDVPYQTTGGKKNLKEE